MILPLIKEKIKKMPSFIGVYSFLKMGEPIYIGKSINVKARILSHLENARLDRKEKLIIKNADHIEYFVTDSEFKALILESKLIRSHYPRYNTRWKDDKSYLYLRITIKDDYPKVLPTRKSDEKGVRHFGPFPSVQSVDYLIREIRKISPFCSQAKISKRPCFYFKIGLCNPCPSNIEKVKEPHLKKKIIGEYKGNIRNVIRILEGKTEVVEKRLINSLKKLIKAKRYEEAIKIRNRLQYFHSLINQQFRSLEESIYNQSEKALKELNIILKPFFPLLTKLDRIECYDVSNLLLKEASASMVVMEKGNIARDKYRKFKIKNPKVKSDFEMIEETLNRRFRNNWPLPDLIIIDGGIPQVHKVIQVTKRNKLDIPVIGIAKHPDRLIAGIQNMQRIKIGNYRFGFNLVRRLRDESHRFARKYHLWLRDKSFLKHKIRVS